MPDRLYGALVASAVGKSGNINVHIPETFMRSDFDGRFTLRAAYNDLTLAHNLARQFGVPLLTTLPALEEMKATMDRGLGGRDAAKTMALHEDRSGVHARP